MQRILCSIEECLSVCVFLYTLQQLLMTIPCRYVLDQILSGEVTETVVKLICEYLTTLGENICEGKIKLDEFIVFKVSFCLLVAKHSLILASVTG